MEPIVIVAAIIIAITLMSIGFFICNTKKIIEHRAQFKE